MDNAQRMHVSDPYDDLLDYECRFVLLKMFEILNKLE